MERERGFSEPQSCAGFGAKVRLLPPVYARVEVLETFLERSLHSACWDKGVRSRLTHKH